MPRLRPDQAAKQKARREANPEKAYQDYLDNFESGRAVINCRKFFQTTLKGWATRCYYDIQKSSWKCTVTKEDLIRLYHKQNGRCAFTGFKFKFSTKPKCMSRASVDRINRMKGYHVDNIRLVWMWVNMAKNLWTDAQLLSCAKLLSKYNYLDGTNFK